MEGRIYIKWSGKFFSKKVLNFVSILYFSSIREEVGMGVLERGRYSFLYGIGKV